MPRVMPGPAVYVFAVVGTVAAVIAFKEFVYEPHIAPKLEQWAEDFVARRRARRRQREGPVASQPHSTYNDGGRTSRRFGDGQSDDGDDRTSIELEKLVAKEVDEWRNGVEQSGLRQRRNASQRSVMDESNASIPFVPLSPTHVLFNSDEPSTPTSVGPARSVRSGTFSVSDFGSDSVGGSELPASATQRFQSFRAPLVSSPRPSYPSPRLPTPVSNFSSRAPSPDNLTAMSTMSQSAVFQTAHSSYASPRIDAAASPGLDVSVLSRARSETFSPFSLASEGDDVLSMRSGVSSLAGSVHGDDDLDVQSLNGSEISSWASVNSDGRH